MIKQGKNRTITLRVNGQEYEQKVECRKLLSDFLREDLHLTGTHAGCEHGVCGSCTVFVNGMAIRSCLMFAVQAEHAEVVTVEGLAEEDGSLHPMQQAFTECHGLQCGYCTPGMMISAIDLLRHYPEPTEQQIREGMAGNICRCTGYKNIIDSIKKAAGDMSKLESNV